MNKEELTIGNYVYVAHQHSNMGGDYDLEFIPEKLTLEHFKFWTENDWNNTDFDEFLKPIPLTPEILENNGFVKSQMISDTPPYDKDEEGNMHFSLNDNFWGWWQQNQTFLIPANGLGWLEFKYVHELQHALRLCRIEKEIKFI